MFSEASVSHSVHNRPHGYSVTGHPCYSAVGMHPTGMLSCCHPQTKFAKVILSKTCQSFCSGVGGTGVQERRSLKRAARIPLECILVTASKRSLRRLCQSFCSQGVWGVCLSARWDTPPDHAPTPPLGPCIHPPGTMHPPGTEHAGRYGQRAGGTHPTGMQSCFK